MPTMVQVVYGNNIKNTFCTFTRNYSVCRAFSGHRCSRNGFLRVARSSICYELILRISSRRNTGNETVRSYYDVLQLTPKATQAQVKSAYYKLSKAYHPDQSKGEDTSVRFREITEAYEVLGNFRKRKMYDKGLLSMSTAASPAEAEEYASRFYESRSKRSQAPTATGRTPIFDFDEWTKLHYESSRVRRGHAKERYERILKTREVTVEEKKSNAIVSLVVLGVILYGIHYCSQENYDSGKTKNK